MNLNKTFNAYRLLTQAHKVLFDSAHKELSVKYTVKRLFRATDAKIMSQKSITSFFKVTPPKTVTVNEEIVKSEVNVEKSPVVDRIEKRSSKRQRVKSSESETEVLTSPKVKSEKVKKRKRQQIESSSSESESTALEAQKSPILKKLPSKEEKSPPTKNKKSPLRAESSIKVEKSSKPKTYESPKSKKRKSKTLTEANEADALKKSASPKSESDVKERPASDEDDTESHKENTKVKLEADNEKVSETEYNPGKVKYHPIKDACWSVAQPVPYLALTQTLEAIETTSARLKIVDTLANYFRSVIALTPEDLLPSVYMCLNKLAPAYHSLELGIAETYLMKAVGQCTGRSLAATRAAAAQHGGDLGAAAAAARATQRTMFPPPPLALRNVFAALKEIAHMSGHASVNKKINKIQTLFVACRHSEAKFLIRSLEGKLRIGLAEQSVLQALAVASALTPPDPDGVKVLDASKGVHPDVFKSRVDSHALLVKTTYCECPNYELVVPTLLRLGAAALPAHCRLSVGIPLKPMLAHPTRGVHEVFNRFEGSKFTCEWKYDGERAQIHVPEAGGAAPDYQNASIFSRNQENNTSKYPDVVARLPALLKESVSSCVLDCEAVAWDAAARRILPFQVLATRKRKAAAEADIKVQVCVFLFDLLLLNGVSLVKEPFARRRELLREHFNEVPGAWQFATSRDCGSMEEVQQFLEESVKGSCEGLMVKTLTGDHAHYDIARRSRNWLKLKKDYLEGAGDSIDVVIIGAYRGKGRRHGVYGGFLAAAREPHADRFQALCKLGTGFSDEDLQTLTAALEPHVIPAPRTYYSFDSSHAPDVWLAAAAVWEVRCADLSLSPSHRAAIGLVDPDKGISLRFPRFVRVREDKTPEQATSAQQIADMYLAQDQVKNQLAKNKHHEDDFY